MWLWGAGSGLGFLGCSVFQVDGKFLLKPDAFGVFLQPYLTPIGQVVWAFLGCLIGSQR
jgi:hypothetical protein